ncbi:MAG: tetratricopeptide repeat protein [Bacillota bacterium]
MSSIILILSNKADNSKGKSLYLTLSKEFTVFQFSELEQLLTALSSAEVDLILCDCTISDKAWQDLLLKIKYIDADLPVIIIQDNLNNSLLINIINIGNVNQIISEKADNNELISAVRNGIAKKNHLLELSKKIEALEKVNTENTRLYTLLKENMQYHDDNVLNVIISLANIIEAKDSYTDLHTRRVGNICRRLGKKMNLSEERLKSLELAGYIHDIGKVGIPESILNKPGKLTNEEFAKMKEHTIIGENICKPLSCFEKCLDAIRHHHEKLNGTGYPDGLSGDAISLEARIVSVADIFDALYSVRPYRDRMPMDLVMKILRDEAEAGLIDKNLVDILLDMLTKGEIDDIITDKTITGNMRKGLPHEVYSAYKSKDYIENKRYISLLDSFVESDCQPIVITGEKGSGKTSLLAYWYNHYKKTHPDSFIIIHFTNAFDKDAISIMLRIMQEIKERYMLKDSIPNESKTIITEFPIWLSKIQSEKLVLMIDSIDQVECANYDWLPLYFPPKIRAIFTALNVPGFIRFDTYNWSCQKLEPLSKADRELIIERHLGKYKAGFYTELNGYSQYEEKCSNPLFLRTLIEELKAYTNFNNLEKKISYYLSSADLYELYDKVLERLENDFGSMLIRKVFSLMCLSRNGLTEGEIMSIGELSSIVMTGILSSLDYYITTREGILSFSNNYIRDAAYKKYLSDEESQICLHAKISSYFEAQMISKRIAFELPWHLQLSKLKSRLAAFISKIEVFNIYYESSMLYELWSYWLFLGEEFDFVSEYMNTLDEYLSIEGISQNSVTIMKRIGMFFYNSGRYEEAIAVFDKAYDSGLQLYDKNNNIMLEILKNKADSLLREGKYSEAEEYYKIILDTRENYLGKDHPDTLSSYNDIILLLNYRGCYAESEKLSKYILPLQESLFGSEHTSVGKTLNSLGIILTAKESYDEAELLFKRAYEIFSKNLGKEHPDTTRVMNNLAAVSVDKCNYQEAERLYLQVLYIRERLLGTKHHYTAKSMNNLADVLMLMKKYSEAEKWIRQALDRYVKLFSQEHPDAAIAQTTLAEILYHTSHYQEAEEWCRKAVAAKKIIYGEHNIKTAVSLRLLGQILSAAGRKNEAYEYIKSAMDIFEKQLGSNHTDTKKCKSLLDEISEK